MKKRLLQKMCAVACSMLMMVSAVGMTAQAQASNETPEVSSQVEIVPFADRIEVYYREYNGKLQMRRWNVTRGYWVDSAWITISI